MEAPPNPSPCHMDMDLEGLATQLSGAPLKDGRKAELRSVAVEAGSPDAAQRPQRGKRVGVPKPLSEEESLSEDGGHKVAGSPQVPRTEAEEKRLREEREFQRHKRRRLREEEGQRRLLEAKLAKERRRREAAHDLVASASLNHEDRRRYAAVEAAGKAVVASTARAKTSQGIKALAGGSVDDDAELLSSVFKSSVPRRPKFLVGR